MQSLKALLSKKKYNALDENEYDRDLLAAGELFASSSHLCSHRTSIHTCQCSRKTSLAPAQEPKRALSLPLLPQRQQQQQPEQQQQQPLLPPKAIDEDCPLHRKEELILDSAEEWKMKKYLTESERYIRRRNAVCETDKTQQQGLALYLTKIVSERELAELLLA